MPWNNTPTTEQRQKFVTLANSGRFSISELKVYAWHLFFSADRTKLVVLGDLTL